MARCHRDIEAGPKRALVVAAELVELVEDDIPAGVGMGGEETLTTGGAVCVVVVAVVVVVVLAGRSGAVTLGCGGRFTMGGGALGEGAEISGFKLFSSSNAGIASLSVGCLWEGFSCAGSSFVFAYTLANGEGALLWRYSHSIPVRLATREASVDLVGPIRESME